MPSWGRFAAALNVERVDSGVVALSTLTPFQTIPAGQRWIIRNLILRYIATATVGNRLIGIQLRDPTDLIMAEVRTATVLAASQTATYYFHPGSTRETAFVGAASGASLVMPMPPDLFLGAGDDLRILDGAAIDGADSVRALLHFDRLIA